MTAALTAALTVAQKQALLALPASEYQTGANDFKIIEELVVMGLCICIRWLGERRWIVTARAELERGDG